MVLKVDLPCQNETEEHTNQSPDNEPLLGDFNSLQRSTSAESELLDV